MGMIHLFHVMNVFDCCFNKYQHLLKTSKDIQRPNLTFGVQIAGLARLGSAGLEGPELAMASDHCEPSAEHPLEDDGG